MLANDDWSNTGWRFSQCLKMLGLNVMFLKGREHTFAYPVQGEVHDELRTLRRNGNRLRALVEEAHVVHYIASAFIDVGVNMKGKNVVMQHGGTAYRQGHEHINPVYNQFVDVSIIQMPELLGHGANNEVWVSFPVDTEVLQPGEIPEHGPLKIGHFPSVAKVKGTDAVLRAVGSLEGDLAYRDGFTYTGVTNMNMNLVKWVANLKRLSQCDIYVEACKLTQSGRPYGEWGNTVVEAAALGKVVVTNSLSIERYEREYGQCPLLIANGEAELRDTLRELIRADRAWLREKAVAMREWVVKYHSMEATALKLME
jgi:glycosyltransferase involved in cell wall biosynthesis